MSSKIGNILKSPLIQNSAKISVSNIIMYMLPFIVTPILTRLYTPDAFGEWGVFSSFVIIVNIGLFLGFENVIIQAEEREVPHIIILCIIISACIIASIMIIFYYGIQKGISFFTGFPAPTILFIYLFLYAIYTISYNMANRYEHYYTISFSNIIQGTSQAAFRILFAFISLHTINGLIWGTTIAQGVAAFFILFFLLRAKLLYLHSTNNINNIKILISKYRNFPLYDAPASLLSFAAFNLPVIILSLFFNKGTIGCFSIILQLLLLPMSLIGSAMGKVYYQRISANIGNIQQITIEMLKILSIISVLPLLFIVCGGDKIIVLFLGSQWESAGNITLCLSLWSFPTILTQPLLSIFRIKNKQRTLLFFDFMYFLLGIGSILIMCSVIHNILVVILIYSLCCFIVKTALFIHILAIGNINIHLFNKYSLILWGVTIIIFMLRITVII